MRRRRARAARLLAACAALAPALVVGAAHADEKRDRQDYGRPAEPTTPEDVGAWAPRVVLFPLWLVSEYAVRRPVGALVRTAEEKQWPEDIIDFFTFGERRQVTIYPSALFDFGLKPSVGFNATWKYFLTDPNTLRLHFGTWGPDWISVRAVDTYQFGKHESVSLDASFVNRKDNPFYGMGPRSPQEPRFRFQSRTSEAHVRYDNRFWRSSEFTARSGLRAVQFGDDTCCDEPSIGDGVRTGNFPPPPGFGHDYAVAVEGASLVIDSREPTRTLPGGGVRVGMHGEGSFAPSSDVEGRRAWVKYGGFAGVAFDLTKSQRVVSLNLTADFADPLVGIIPFTDQVSLGGDNAMRGYLRNRLIDRSAAVASLQYTWPVWVFLDGVIQADVGNVFGPHLEGFDMRLMRLSSGIGVRSNGRRDSGFELLVAGGTDPFESGFKVTSFRFVLGSHHGF